MLHLAHPTNLIGDLLSCLAHVQLLCRHTRRSASQSSRCSTYLVAAAHNVLQLHGSATAAAATAAAAPDCKQRPAIRSSSSTTGAAWHRTRLEHREVDLLKAKGL